MTSPVSTQQREGVDLLAAMERDAKEAAIYRSLAGDHDEARAAESNAARAAASKLLAAMEKIRAAHTFNVAQMPAHEVHAIAFEALAACERAS